MTLSNRSDAAGKMPTGNSAITNNPLVRWSGTTATGRRVRDLYRSYMRQLDSPTDAATQALAISAAEQMVIAELVRDECMAGATDIKINSVVRAESSASRALRRLGLNKAAPPPPRKPLAERLAEAEARGAADAAKGAEMAPLPDQRTSEAGAEAYGAAA